MKRRRWGLYIAAVVFIAVVAVLYTQGKLGTIDTKTFLHNQPGSYAVKQFVDGDTVMVDMNGTTEIIRFIGIDTPETHKPNTPVQCYGPAAAAFTKNRIGSGRIRLVSDSLTTNRDRYNRLLRYVVLEDGTTLNKELVQKGYAFAYAFPFARSDEFFTAMEQAQTAKAGLWGNCVPYQNPTTGQWHTEDN